MYNINNFSQTSIRKWCLVLNQSICLVTLTFLCGSNTMSYWQPVSASQCNAPSLQPNDTTTTCTEHASRAICNTRHRALCNGLNLNMLFSVQHLNMNGHILSLSQFCVSIKVIGYAQRTNADEKSQLGVS